jgi:hypothetical protein
MKLIYRMSQLCCLLIGYTQWFSCNYGFCKKMNIPWQCNTENHASVVENTLFQLPELNTIFWNVAYREPFTPSESSVSRLWSTDHHVNSKQFTRNHRDYIQATTEWKCFPRWLASRTESVPLLVAFQQTAVLLNWEIILNLFPSTLTFASRRASDRPSLGFPLPSFKCWDGT